MLPATQDGRPSPAFVDRLGGVIKEIKSSRSKSQQEAVYRKFQGMMQRYGSTAGGVLMSLLKTKNTELKEAVLSLLGSIIDSNTSRTKLGADLARRHQFSQMLGKVSTDGFMVNSLYALLLLCKPFLNKNDPRLKKIDPLYVMSGKRFDIHNETPACKDVRFL